MLAVKAENLSYSYPDGTPALQEISFTVPEGEKMAIVGPNGSGKSTLITLLNGVRQGKGLLEILSLSLNRSNLPQIKQWVGVVFQNPDDQLFCPTIFEDIAFGPLNQGLPADEVRQRVENALQSVGLEGYQKRSSFHLSFGERKLASLATVVAMDPRIIALDEPTSNLDLSHRRKIIRWLQKNPHTIILTTHDLDMALDTCQRVMILNKGKIVADGRSQELLSDRMILEENDLELPLRMQTPHSVKKLKSIQKINHR
jgi:cobalt/nickel transport system ATP-binding protein